MDVIAITNTTPVNKENNSITQEYIITKTQDDVNSDLRNTSAGGAGINQAFRYGLLHYRKWWERVEAEILVNGKLITGIPIFIEENTLRVINKDHSYFIPLEKVDYIRTNDGLDPSLN